MTKKLFSARRWRTASVLMLGAVIGIMLVAQPAGAHFLPSINHIWNHLKPKADARYIRQAPKYISAFEGIAITGTFANRTTGCETATYTPKRPETALINTSASVIGGATGTTFATRAAYSDDGGATFKDALPAWGIGASASAGNYAANTNTGVVNLAKGTHYQFAVSGYVFAQDDSTGGECKVVVEIVPRKAGAGVLSRAPVRARSAAN